MRTLKRQESESDEDFVPSDEELEDTEPLEDEDEDEDEDSLAVWVENNQRELNRLFDELADAFEAEPSDDAFTNFCNFVYEDILGNEQ